RADGVLLAPVLRARRRGRHRERRDGGRARHRGRTACLSGRRARGVRAPHAVDEADAALAGPGTEGVQETAAHEDLTLRRGGLFAVWVSAIMLSEQALLIAAVLTVDATAKDVALAGIVFNVLL